MLSISRYYCKSSAKWIENARALTLPGDAFRDRYFLDWVLADKSGESDLLADFQDLMLKQHEKSVSEGKIGAFDVLAARDNLNLPSQSDAFVEAQLNTDQAQVEKNLNTLASIYGHDQLKNMSDSEVYALYKNHAASK